MKRNQQRRRGKGKPSYKARSHKFKADSSYKTFNETEKSSLEKGVIIDLINDPARKCPLMLVKFNECVSAIPAPLGVKVGLIIEQGVSAKPIKGNVMPLSSIPEGTTVFNIERVPGDGGKLVKTAGESAKLVSKDKRGVMIQLPSRKFKVLNSMCRATIGVIAGGGHKEKPFVKAGKKWRAKRAKTGKWPHTSRTSMNPVEHPHGGGGGRGRKSKTVSRHAPPGAKVGSIASKRTGKRN